MVIIMFIIINAEKFYRTLILLLIQQQHQLTLEAKYFELDKASSVSTIYVGFCYCNQKVLGNRVSVEREVLPIFARVVCESDL